MMPTACTILVPPAKVEWELLARSVAVVQHAVSMMPTACKELVSTAEGEFEPVAQSVAVVQRAISMPSACALVVSTAE